MVSGRFLRFYGNTQPREGCIGIQGCVVVVEAEGSQCERFKEALERTLDSMAAAAARAGRDPTSVRLVAATKTLLPSHIVMAINAGLRIFGENRVQEALVKMRALTSRESLERSLTDVSWHMIGHLQKNKVKSVVGNFDLIHSVDSLALAQAIDDRARMLETSQQILLQVNVSGELSKYGLSPTVVRSTIHGIASMKHVHLRGLMTIPPFAETSQQTRAIFRRLRSLATEIEDEGIDGVEMTELSMGMSDDYEIAIEEGATLVRIGRGIFGERKALS
jgi:pyridoxal phosphate enzyme (YggS family)